MYSGGHKARPYKITTKHTTTSGGQYRLSSQRSIAQTTYAVVICFIHFATTPSTNLSIPLSLRLFPLPLHPLEEEGGPIKRYIRDFRFCACEKNPLSPSERSSNSPCKTCPLLWSTRAAMKDPPSDGLFPPFPPAQLRWQGERYISNEISRYKRKIRVYR